MNSLARYNRGQSRQSLQKYSSDLGLSENFKKSMENMRQGAGQIEQTKDLIRMAIDLGRGKRKDISFFRLLLRLSPRSPFTTPKLSFALPNLQ